MTILNPTSASQTGPAILVNTCLAAPAGLWHAILARHARSVENRAMAVLDDHLRHDLGLPATQPSVKAAPRFI